MVTNPTVKNFVKIVKKDLRDMKYGRKRIMFLNKKQEQKQKRKPIEWQGNNFIVYDLTGGSYEEIDRLIDEGYQIIAGHSAFYPKIILLTPISSRSQKV